MEKQKNYQQFDLEDFISDDQFIQWAQGKTPERDAFWENYIHSNPLQKQGILQAKEIVAAFQFEEPAIEDDFFDRLNNRLNQSIDLEDATKNADAAKEVEEIKPSGIKSSGYKLAYQIISGIAAVLLIALAFIFYPRQIVIENGFAGIRQIVLPDSSIVVLNANSTLSYPANWNKNDREVKLTGEGFFKIRHLLDKGSIVPFTVQANDLKLHVLGTSFNVTDRNNLIEVILKTGRLKVTHQDQEIFMKPADHLIYDQKKDQFSMQKAANDDYLDWTRLEFVFNDLSIASVAEKLEYFYGVKIHFEDESFKDEKLSGRLGLSNLNEALQTLELLLNKKIVTNGKDITIVR